MSINEQPETLAETNKNFEVSKTLVIKKSDQKDSFVIEDIDFDQ